VSFFSSKKYGKFGRFPRPPPTKILWFEVAGPFFFVWCEISPEIIKRCSHNRTARQGSLFKFCVIENLAIISKKISEITCRNGLWFSCPELSKDTKNTI
jgi:hypothetical protein